MKRRLMFFGGAAALYVALMAVAWTIGTRQAMEKTEAQLDYAVLDLHSTLAGAIDTMLGHIARTAVRHIGSARQIPMELMSVVAKELDIDEVNVVSREGRIIASNDPHSLGVMMAGDPVMDAFMTLTNGVTPTVSQPFRPHARNPEFRAKYLAAAFPGGDGFVQVGLEDHRLARMMPDILGYIFDEWLLGNTGFFLCSDMATGCLISNPSRHRDEARDLLETGFRPEEAARYEVVADGRARGATFVQRLFGEKCYCRAVVFGGHRFVAALPEHEYYDTRTAYVSVFAVLLFVILAAFALFLDRIFRDADRLRAFYAAEEDARAKDMEIAKTIQTSALPAPLGDSPYFRLSASMTPARDVGGDFYDFFMLDSTHLAFMVADVSGKGVTAALYMMTAKTLLKDAMLATRDPSAAFARANSELCRSNTANMFLTAWGGVLDIETGKVTYVNAGHNPPVKVAGGKPEYVTGKSGPVLAFMDGIDYGSRTLSLKPGETLFLYTDGVTEALDRQDKLFGETRLTDAINAVDGPDPKMLCNVVRMAVAAFSEGVPQSDDMTVLAVEYVSRPKRFVRTFPPTLEGIASASAFIDECAEGQATLPALHIILDEICSNIVRHSGASGFEVEVEPLVDPEGTKLTFIDDGAPYDPLAHEDPDTTLPASERPIGGLGIMMVKKMSDSVSYERTHDRNYLTVVKRSVAPA